MDAGPTGVARVAILDTIGSTNTEALRRARAGEPGPLWLMAREQTAGRGRRGRAWVSPPGNLYATLLLIDPAPVWSAPQLGFLAALAVHDAAVSLAPELAARLALKWPNDVLCAGRKIAGILVEGEGDPLTVAIGIGVNCRAHPPGMEFPATDFREEGATIAAEDLFGRLRVAMDARIRQWNRSLGFASVRAAWLERAYGLASGIRVRLAAREITGRFEAIDADGRLMLRAADGSIEAIAAGEVFPMDQNA